MPALSKAESYVVDVDEDTHGRIRLYTFIGQVFHLDLETLETDFSHIIQKS